MTLPNLPAAREEAERISRELAKRPGFRWAPGMAALVPSLLSREPTRFRIYRGSFDTLCAQGEPSGYVAGWRETAAMLGAAPDLDDPATVGVLLGMLTPLVPDGEVRTATSKNGAIVVVHARRRLFLRFVGPSLGLALASALLSLTPTTPENA